MCCLDQGGVSWAEGETCSLELCVDACPTSCTEKGSLLIFSNVEVRWDANGNLTQDVFIQLSNDHPNDLRVIAFFVNGDEPLAATEFERAHPGWNHVSNSFWLTGNQPVSWKVSTGDSDALGGLSPFTVLDPAGPGDLPGRPAMDGTTDRVLRGFIYLWAVDNQRQEIRWNHLSGDATIVSYAGDRAAWQYNACAFRMIREGVAHGQPSDSPGELRLNGIEYCAPPSQLLMNLQTVGSDGFSSAGTLTMSDTDVTLHPVSVDFRAHLGATPITTKADYAVWNTQRVKFGAGFRCVTCWDQTLLSQYGIDQYSLAILMSHVAKVRIDGIASALCDTESVQSEAAALLGVASRKLRFDSSGHTAMSGVNLIGMGFQPAVIHYELLPFFEGLAAPSDPDGVTSPFEAADRFILELMREAERRQTSGND